ALLAKISRSVRSVFHCLFHSVGLWAVGARRRQALPIWPVVDSARMRAMSADQAALEMKRFDFVLDAVPLLLSGRAITPESLLRFLGPIKGAKLLSALSLPKAELQVPGSLHIEFRRCGIVTCHCANGELHGPYHFLHWLDQGRPRKQYIPASDLRWLR